jgi:hypothetical protein
VVAACVVVVACVVVAGGVVRTSFVVVAGLVAVCAVVLGAPTVVVDPEPPFKPALIKTTAIVTAARNAAGAPYRVSS